MPFLEFLMPVFTRPGRIFPSTVPGVQHLFTLVTPLCSFHSWKTHHPFLSMVINYKADNMYTTKIKPFLPTFQQLINPSLVVLISLFPSREMYHLSPDIKGECPAVALTIAYFPVETMPGHDHSLRGLFEPESLNSETMLVMWICPVKQSEASPAEALGCIFTKYQELLRKQGHEREYLRVGFSASLFEDIEWPLMDSYLKHLH